MTGIVRHVALNLCALPTNLGEVGHIENKTIFIIAANRGIPFEKALSRGANQVHAVSAGRFE